MSLRIDTHIRKPIACSLLRCDASETYNSFALHAEMLSTYAWLNLTLNMDTHYKGCMIRRTRVSIVYILQIPNSVQTSWFLLIYNIYIYIYIYIYKIVLDFI